MNNTKAYYRSPLGIIEITADEYGLTSLHFVDQDIPSSTTSSQTIPDTIAWLDTYFAGKIPEKAPALHLIGTAFQRSVWQALLAIPYGQVRTYSQLADQLNSSPRAVGNAVGKNPVLLIVPCHRVVGQGGRLTGYSGGLERKRQLLNLENITL